jgi:hypothetical protein
VCAFDGRPCEVETALGRDFTDVADYLPCGNCRGADDARAKLHGIRLGKREREILLTAAAPDARRGTVILPDCHDHATRESALRAWRGLRSKGLLVYDCEWNRVETRARDSAGRPIDSAHITAAARLSPLGAKIVDAYRRELEGGLRIRWDSRLDACVAAVRQTGNALTAAFLKNLSDRAGSLEARFDAGFGSEWGRSELRRVRDALGAAVQAA